MRTDLRLNQIADVVSMMQFSRRKEEMKTFGISIGILLALTLASCQSFVVGQYPIGKNAWVHTQTMFGDKLATEYLFNSWTAGYKSAIAESSALTSDQKQQVSNDFGKFTAGTYYTFWFSEFSLFGKIPAMYGDDLKVQFQAFNSNGDELASETFSWIEKRYQGSDITYKYVWVVKLADPVKEANLPMNGLYFNVNFPDGTTTIYPRKK